ncbi:MAG: hypothetical protein ACYTGD_11200 [Planctomycetota bacterium]|jgi:hypothetical protein
MNLSTIRIACVVTALLSGAAVAQTGTAGSMTSAQRAEFTKLVHQRNALYNLTKQAQGQLDIIEHRLDEIAARHHLEVPPRPVQVSAMAYGAASPFAEDRMTTVTPKQRAEFNKLVLRRNKLHARLTVLDEQASELIKRGHKPVVVHAQQVSALDELDLIELQLAMLATRYELPVPPVPGRDPLPGGQVARPDDETNRSLDQAFARGRNRAMKRLRDDTDRFLASLDFDAFINY